MNQKIADTTEAVTVREPATAGARAPSVVEDAAAYLLDAAQRTILFWDVMRERGNQYIRQQKSEVPHVLDFAFELLIDGRTLPNPVNYGLVRILPPAGITVDSRKRPFVVVDPRAGHGPGIGGFKADSEIGVALRAGHPCYFIGFLPDPVPGQTIEDVARAEAAFLEHVNALHADAEGKPAVIGNCQAGWAIMMVAAIRPELFGPIIIAGSPLSYWNGVRGANPMRYSGGLLGGSWLTALTSDLGNGTFDGGWLVQNFENLNPANTLWTKQYNLYANIDTEAPRYLGFEKYWDAHVRLTGAEMQFIVDELFVGNKLASGDVITQDGVRVDLRAIRSPIIVFCSKGDNITPPQQALGWILDLYGSVDEIRMCGQTIVYAIHESVGHLGIFVSGGVARKEHDEFASNIDLIDVLPPGLYEAVLREKTPDDSNGDLARGAYIARFELRTLDDIRALGGNDDEDDRCFATAARLSEINHGLYRGFVSPLIRLCANDASASLLRDLHPLRLQYELFSDRNPFCLPVPALAEVARATRAPVGPANVFVAAQEMLSNGVVAALNAWRDARDTFLERRFFAIYGSPFLQSLLGERASDAAPRRRAIKEPLHLAWVLQQVAELRARMSQGGAREAMVRALVYLGLASGAADERAFATLKQIRAAHGQDITLQAFKALVREQFFMLFIDEDEALRTLPDLVRRGGASITDMADAVRHVATAAGPLDGLQRERLARIQSLLTEPVDGSSKPGKRHAGRDLSSSASVGAIGS
ncbi:MAG: DUF3141 domain-containing protein [Proteobacteria bacterium]|nr:DUF3141 domain-containing protein [Pseudomonadota bacterium]